MILLFLIFGDGELSDVDDGDDVWSRGLWNCECKMDIWNSFGKCCMIDW